MAPHDVRHERREGRQRCDHDGGHAAEWCEHLRREPEHRRVEDGEAQELRLFPDLSQLPRLRYEAALLEALSNAGLPFRLPLPIRTHSGESVAFLEQEAETSAFASLSPFLQGKHPDRNDPSLAPPAAAALAALDKALAALPGIAASAGLEPRFTYGGLVRGYAPIPDPLAAVQRLPIERDKALQIQSILASVQEEVADLYTRLPQQLLHLDYDPANIYMEDGRVTAVFDFEFASIDLRVMELCVALSWWPVKLMGTGKEWQVIDAFATPYVADFPLGEEELRAMPEVLRLRDAASLVHRMERYFAGLETDVTMQKRVEHSLWREAWLLTQREVLLQHAMAWG